MSRAPDHAQRSWIEMGLIYVLWVWTILGRLLHSCSFCLLVGLRVMCLYVVRFMYGKRGLCSIFYSARFCILQFLRHFSRSWYVWILRVMKLEGICRDGVRWTLLFWFLVSVSSLCTGRLLCSFCNEMFINDLFSLQCSAERQGSADMK
jgi:hypothetical protein